MVQFNIEKTAFFVYDLAWRLVIPFLKLNRRLAEGYPQRRFSQPTPAPADLWIQAASVGEAFLAWQLLKQLTTEKPLSVLITTNTRQGMDILEKAIREISSVTPGISAAAAYFPFDKPGIMNRAVGHIRPRVMVLLESEMWPAHLAALKASGCHIVIVNGRMTAKSLKGYLHWPSFWYRLRPDKILAISDKDARHFGRLFGQQRVEVMSNIKFDRLDLSPESSRPENPLSAIFAPEARLIVFGSIRRPEEEPVQKVLLEIKRRHPAVTVGLFPRHFQRLDAWISFLTARKVPWCLRSGIDQPVAPGTVVLWDTYGELTFAYQLAAAAFVGGTLAPLGGQNFLEPLTAGIRPIIGPSWENFYWVGGEIISRGLVRVVPDWEAVVDTLTDDLKRPPSADHVKSAAYKYVGDRQGGTARACGLIEQYLK